jgi:hypothetical protein
VTKEKNFVRLTPCWGCCRGPRPRASRSRVRSGCHQDRSRQTAVIGTQGHCLVLRQGILKGEVSLYPWPPVWLVWINLFCKWKQKFQLSCSWFQTSQTGGQWYSNTSPFSIPWLRFRYRISDLRYFRRWSKMILGSVYIIPKVYGTGKSPVGIVSSGRFTNTLRYLTIPSYVIKNQDKNIRHFSICLL